MKGSDLVLFQQLGIRNNDFFAGFLRALVESVDRLLLNNMFLRLILESYNLNFMISFGPCFMHLVLPEIFSRDT